MKMKGFLEFGEELLSDIHRMGLFLKKTILSCSQISLQVHLSFTIFFHLDILKILKTLAVVSK